MLVGRGEGFEYYEIAKLDSKTSEEQSISPVIEDRQASAHPCIVWVGIAEETKEEQNKTYAG